MKANSLEVSDLLAGSPDLEARFLAELRARRERLAQWIRLIETEVRRQDMVADARTPRRCRAIGSKRRPAPREVGCRE